MRFCVSVKITKFTIFINVTWSRDSLLPGHEHILIHALIKCVILLSLRRNKIQTCSLARISSRRFSSTQLIVCLIVLLHHILLAVTGWMSVFTAFVNGCAFVFYLEQVQAFSFFFFFFSFCSAACVSFTFVLKEHRCHEPAIRGQEEEDARALLVWLWLSDLNKDKVILMKVNTILFSVIQVCTCSHWCSVDMNTGCYVFSDCSKTEWGHKRKSLVNW